MKNSVDSWNKFYQNLGHLFYAVAASDRDIANSEIEALKDCVRTYWLNVESSVDEFDTDAAYQIEVVFDWLVSERTKSDDAFDDFKEFIKEKPQFLNAQTNTLILNTCLKIADSFYGVNNYEKEIIKKLKSLLA